ESESPAGDQPFRLKSCDHRSQMFIAGGKESSFFGRTQFVRRAVAARALDECQWAIVHHNVTLEKVSGGSETVSKEAPEALSADFRTQAVESVYRTTRMLAC